MYNETELSDKAFEQYFLRFNKVAVAFALRIVGDREIAEDLVQEVFIKIWESKKYQTQDIVKQRLYLFTSCKWVCQNYLKKKRLHEKHLSRFLNDNTESDASSYSPLNLVNAENSDEKLEQLAEAIDQLGPQRRDVLSQIVFQERSYLETARILGKSPNTIKTLYKNARKQLATFLSETKFSK